MFNYHNRQYVFRQSSGEFWNFFSDSRQNVCCNTLTRRGTWGSSTVILKNVHPYFYVDMDQEDTFHLLYQDNDGNIHYSRLDGQTAKSVPVLNSRTPSAYNKQLFLAPFKNNVHIFFVLQHENSFMLAYQILGGNGISNPRVVDYVSGSSLPCALAYDRTQNIYAFYQSYDGKYLQLGYKKLNTAQKSWSEFTPVTKYAGNCEYPHVLVDGDGIIHLCYQRRASKFFEMVYQQKTPDRNLWTAEEIVHSSVYSFENASIVQENDNIVVYWVREETIYYNSASRTGNNWGKASKLNFPAGRQLQCICYKTNSSHSFMNEESSSKTAEKGNSALPPSIYPGIVSNGLRMAFNTGDSIGDVSQLFGISEEPAAGDGSGDFSYRTGHTAERFQLLQSTPRGRGGSSGPAGYSGSSGSTGGDIKNLVLDAFKQLQNRIDEVREGSFRTKEELVKLTNAYDQLNRELAKYTIRLTMLESQLGLAKRLGSRVDELSSEMKAIKEAKKPDLSSEYNETVPDAAAREHAREPGQAQEHSKEPEAVQEHVQAMKQEQPQNQTQAGIQQKKPPFASLDPDKLKEFEEWQEPEEWREDEH